MLVRFIRWFHGFLKIKLIGYSPERFLNICKNRNINIWNVKSWDNHYEIYILVKDFRKIRPICKKTKIKIRIIDRYGLPFILYKYKNRKTFVVGFILSILLIYVSSKHLWQIEIDGNKKITDDLIYTYLESELISCGKTINTINCKNLAAKIRENFKEVIWVSVSVDGTHLIISLRENTSNIIEDDNTTPSDLVAPCDGIITKIVTRSGIPLVETGAEVKKGDILVSGNIPIINDNQEIISNTYVAADAEILGKVVIHYQDIIPSSYKKKIYSEKSAHNSNKEIFTDYKWFPFEKIKEYKFVESEYTEDERSKILQENYYKYCDELLKNHTTILESDLLITHYENMSIAVNYMIVEQPMKESRKLIDLSSENMLQ